MTPTDAIPILIGEQWITPDVEAHTPVYRPATGEVIGRTPQCARVEVDLAVEAASRAFPNWSATPAPERARVLFRYRELLEEQFEHLAEMLCGENGKTREEARGDVRRGIEVVELACGIGQMAKGEVLPELAAGIDGALPRASRWEFVRWYHAVQLPGHGAHVDVPAGHCLRQLLRAETEREGAVHGQSLGRTVS